MPLMRVANLPKKINVNPKHKMMYCCRSSERSTEGIGVKGPTNMRKKTRATK